MAVGSSNQYNIKAELYSFGIGVWKTVDDYPYATGKGVYGYEMVFIPVTKSYFVIGGATGQNGEGRVSHIAKLTNGPWYLAELKSVRSVRFFLFPN